jgi:hypothetical protein
MNIEDFASRVEGRLVRAYNRALSLRPSSAPYVSGDSFRALSDHRLEEKGQLEPARIRDGELVFVKSDRLPIFFSDYLPSIRARFVLVSHNSDANIDEALARRADDERIIRWFAHNLLATHPKLEAVPIGLENLWLHANGEVRDFDRLRSGLREKKNRILYAFSLGTNPAERGPALAALKSSRLADGPSWTTSSAYRECLAGYSFVASPPGNGFDCHRTWEALYLGTIPIVKRSPFFEAFPGLPVLVVDDWREIATWDEDFLKLTYDRLQPQIAPCPYLRMDYWIDEIDKWRERRKAGPGRNHGL